MGVKNQTVFSSQITRGSSLWSSFAGDYSSVPAPNEKTALMVSAIYSCVNLRAGAIASMPLNVFSQKTDGERIRLTNDDLWWILNEEFNPRWNAVHGWEFLELSLCLHGNAFAEILRKPDGSVRGLMPIHPARVTVYVTTNGERLVYSVQPEPLSGIDQRVKILDQDDMIHVAGLGFDGLLSPSPLRYSIKMAGGVAIAAQDYSGTFFANSARPDFVIETDGPLSDENLAKLKARIDENHQGPANHHKPMLLTNGLKYKSISLPLEDIQLLETRKFQIEEIARVYGVPPFMIGHNEKTTSWGSGMEAMGIGFVRYTLRPSLTKICTELNRKLFKNAGRVVEFDTSDLEKADMKTLFESYRIGLGRAGEAAFITTDEVRDRLNLPRIPNEPLKTQASL
jgi:HK97 family phage portal protein